MSEWFPELRFLFPAALNSSLPTVTSPVLSLGPQLKLRMKEGKLHKLVSQFQCHHPPPGTQQPSAHLLSSMTTKSSYPPPSFLTVVVVVLIAIITVSHWNMLSARYLEIFTEVPGPRHTPQNIYSRATLLFEAVTWTGRSVNRWCN